MTGLTDFIIDYASAVVSYFWLLIPGIVLTLVDLVAKLRKQQSEMPRQLVIWIFVGGLIVAQALAYRDLWTQHHWLKPNVLQGLLRLAREGEKIFQTGMRACKETKSMLEAENEMDRWENGVVEYMSQSGLGEGIIAEFKSDTGWTISGRIFTECGNDRIALHLSKLEHKIGILKRLCSSRPN